MGRFLAFLFVFVLGGIIGLVVGGFGGAAAGGYLGACKVIDQAVAGGTMTQDEANALVGSIANDLDIKPEQKAQIVERLKKANQPPSACATAIQTL
jgi:polyhydroxyalkanoate synthesis regulator phasin